MQLRRLTAVSPLLALAVQLCVGYNTRLHAALHHQVATTTASGAWAVLAEVEADDKQFWDEQWVALEATLLQLQAVSNSAGVEEAAFLQAKNSTNAPRVGTSPVAHPGSTSAGVKQPRALAAGPELNLNPKSAADLAPALAMLRGLYEDGKERIGQLNTREKQSKQRYEEMQKKHDARLATIEARFKNHTLSAEFHKNETRDENRLWSYWQRVRERQHRQFHTSLKIQHGTMQKVKTMIDMYEKAISGKANQAEMKKDLAKVTGVVPEVVFLQRAWRADAPYFSAALAEARAARSALGRGAGRR